MRSIPSEWQRRKLAAARNRHGLSLMLVMVAISLSLMLTFATVSSQSRGLQVRHNVNRHELARRAAESGAAIALGQMQSPDWAGVLSPIQGTLESDAFGSTSYSVEFRTIDGQTSPAAYPAGQGLINLGWWPNIYNTNSAGLNSQSADASATATRQAFQLLARVTGQWQSALNPADHVAAVTEVGVELQPRVPGRLLMPGDSASANDLVANSPNYDQVQNYAICATTGSSSNPSVTIEPGQRIDGPIWLQRGIRVFTGPSWGTTPRNEFLTGVGSQFTTTVGGQTQMFSPHPFGGLVTHFTALSSSHRSDLQKLNVPTQQATVSPGVPSVTISNWKRYQLFQGGFTYDADMISATKLDGDALRPTPRNPLGLFYREGNVEIGHNVVLQGTLVCSGRVTFSGDNVLVSSLNWRDGAGDGLLPDATLFPRLPAIVAREVVFNKSVRGAIEGAVLLTSSITGADGHYEERDANFVDIAGSQATCSPLHPPYSQVQLPEGVDCSQIQNDGRHAVWLADGSSGNWFSIAEVDAMNRRLIVVGETRRTGSVGFRVRRQRIHAVDVRGPITATRVQLSVASIWKLNSSLWSSLHSAWQVNCDLEESQGMPQTPFVNWLSNPANYSGWGEPYETYGLRLDPTFHVRPTPDVKYRDSLPLFRGYVAAGGSSAELTDLSGYRWRVLFWRQVP